MTGSAERPKVILGMSAALINGKDVVYFIDWDEAASFEALFAKRMLGDIQVPDGAPAAAVDLVMIGRPVVLVILPTGDSLMSRTVTFAPDSVRAAGISAGF